ncbi:MAG: hypothetical protein LUF35_01965 [Lachnospiraceae bacterium]|nr:hypothetical protein [Lachnospiraceae bacterium]
MVSVETATLKKTAIRLNNYAANLSKRLLGIQDTISWIRRQDFPEAGELRRALEKEYGELEKQKKDMLRLSEALTRISDKYEKTEEKIVMSQNLRTRILAVSDASFLVTLQPLISQIKALGIEVPEE